MTIETSASRFAMNTRCIASILTSCAFGVLSVSALLQTPSFAQTTSLLSSALECRSISIPTNKSWNNFNEGDLPVSSLLVGHENLIKSFQKSQGEDGNTSTIKFKKPEKAFGLNVSTLLLSTDIVGVQQLSSIESVNIEQLKSVIEKELSITFNFADDQYSFFNPTSGIEYKISKDAASPKGYFFACGLNSQLYGEAVQKEESERAEKAKLAQQERDKVEKEKYDKQIEGYLAQNNKVFKEYINDVELAEVYVPAIGAGVGLILLLLGGLFVYLRKQSEGGKSKTMLILAASTGSVGIVLIGLGGIQFLHPVYKVESAKVEQAWKDTAQHVLNNEKYINTYMKAGETLAKDGSMDVATMLASYYVGGVGKVAVDTAKAAYYKSLAVKSTSEPTKIVIGSDANAQPTAQQNSPLAQTSNSFSYINKYISALKSFFNGDSSKLKQAKEFVDHKDYSNALQLYKVLAEDNNPEALIWMGYLNRFGWGTSKDIDKTIYWFERAFSNNNNVAAYELSLLYMNNDFSRKDIVKLMYWLRRGAEVGEINAIENLATAYEYGKMGVPADQKRGLYWREEAVSLGSMISQYRLGQSYIDGSFGREPNRDLAIKLIDKSAAQGFKLAITVASNGYPNSEVNMNIELKKSVCKNMKKGFKDLVDYNVKLGRDPYFHLDSYANSIENMECN